MTDQPDYLDPERRALRRRQWRTMAAAHALTTKMNGADEIDVAAISTALVLVWAMEHPEQARYWQQFLVHELGERLDGQPAATSAMLAVVETDEELWDVVQASKGRLS